MDASDIQTPVMRPYLPATANFASGEDLPARFSSAPQGRLMPGSRRAVTLNLAAVSMAADESAKAGAPASRRFGDRWHADRHRATSSKPSTRSPRMVRRCSGFLQRARRCSAAALREAGRDRRQTT